MTKQQQLDNVLSTIGKLASIPVTREQAIEEGKEYYLEIEFNSYYGGYRLVGVNVAGYGHRGVFGGNGTEARQKLQPFLIYLSGIIAGLKYNSKSQTF